MNVPLPPLLEGFVEEQVRSGRYADASAVVADALRLMQAQHAALRATIEAAIAEGGEYAADEVERELDELAADWRPRDRQ